jgi:hypothetical protein
MTTLLTSAAENSKDLAENRFGSYRRDFEKFLRHARSRYSDLESSHKVDKNDLLANFRTLVLNWLNVFAECSIDPIHNPKRILRDEEIHACLNIASICDLLEPRLNCTEQDFIKLQQEKDKRQLNRYRKEIRRLTASLTDPNMLENGNSSSFSSNGSGNSFENQRTELGRGRSTDGYRKEARFGSVRFALVSRTHARLLLGFAFGLLIIALRVERDFFSGKQAHISGSGSRMLFETIIVQICMFVLLIRFEELDEVQRLQKEIRDLQKAEAEVSQHKQKMYEFWSAVQELADVWIYRTIPRMVLYNELFVLLRDAPDGKVVPWMQKANSCLSQLELNIGSLDGWRTEGSLKLVAKKAFGKEINRLCQSQSFEKITDGLPQVFQVIKPEESDSFKC